MKKQKSHVVNQKLGYRDDREKGMPVAKANKREKRRINSTIGNSVPFQHSNISKHVCSQQGRVGDFKACTSGRHCYFTE